MLYYIKLYYIMLYYIIYIYIYIYIYVHIEKCPNISRTIHFNPVSSIPSNMSSPENNGSGWIYSKYFKISWLSKFIRQEIQVIPFHI